MKTSGPEPTGPETILERRFVLPDDVLFVPVEELAESVRESLDADEGDIAVTRPGFRTPSRLVDGATAELLKSFRPARRIVDAVIQFSLAHSLDPEQTLVDAFPTLQLFSAANLLVPDDSPYVEGIPVAWAPGQVVDGFEILDVVQRTHDTVVYRASGPEGQEVALKVEQPGAPYTTEAALERENAALARLDGGAPGLVGSSEHGGLRYLAVTWVDGVSLRVRAAEIRSQAEPGWRQRLHALACSVAERYAALHDRGILHGDVHPENVIVGPDDGVTLIDFGMSRVPGAGPPYDHELRVGLGWYLDPQAAGRALDGQLPDAIDAAAEQYAVAALVYEVYSGAQYLDFSVEVEPLYRAITRDPVLPFTHRGFEAWPAVESVLQRALQKQPRDRFASTRALADALRAAGPPQREEVYARYEREARRFVDGFLPHSVGELAALRSTFDSAPVVSCDQGAAGLAWFLYRVALFRHRPDLLPTADVWCRRAARELGSKDAFHTPESASDGFSIDDCSVLHRAPGLHYVHALICHARGDNSGLRLQVERFVDASGAHDGVNDVTLGRAGTLLAGTTLWQATRGVLPAASADRLRDFCVEVHSELRSVLSDPAGPGLQAAQPFSFAHGWLGLVYALMRGASVLSVSLPDGFEERVHGLAQALRASASDETAIPGWCNGAAGHVLVFLLARRTFGDDAYAELAEWAAWRAASHPGRHAHLCCGLAGRVFALLHMYRETGDVAWLDRAWALGRCLANSRLPEEGVERPYSLFWGRLGAALALEELTVPEWAAMPLFGDQGWPG